MTNRLHSQTNCPIRDFAVDLPEGRIAARRIDPPGGAPPDAPALVFLHEALGCVAMWKNVPERLVAMTGLPALVYDRHGHGLSAPLVRAREPDYLEIEALDVLPRLLAECGIADPIPLGHSDGGSIALLYASRHPVRALVSEAAHVFNEEVSRQGIREALVAWRETDLPQRLGRYHGEKTEALFFAWADCWLSEEFAAFPELYRPLTEDRNRAWVVQLVDLLDDRDDYLVVVGALHLVGRNSVVDLLRQRGYSVTQH